jgi:uncharacterized protein (UPF0335 family)
MVDVVSQDSKQALAKIVDKIEKLESEKQAVSFDIKSVYEEAKSQGFDTTILRKLISMRKMDDQKLREQEELLDLYKHAVGMV